jgi:uncharacterized FlaG/YvyC family protein
MEGSIDSTVQNKPVEVRSQPAPQPREAKESIDLESKKAAEKKVAEKESSRSEKPVKEAKAERSSGSEAIANQALKEALKDIAGTAVRFQISGGDSGEKDSEKKSDALKFQVVDKESGQVIREFPAKEAKSIVSKSSLPVKGAIVSEVA